MELTALRSYGTLLVDEKGRLFSYSLGTGVDITIRELVEMIGDITGLRRTICFNEAKPDGTPRKLLDVSKLGALSWGAKTDLQEGLVGTCEDFVNFMCGGLDNRMADTRRRE